MVKTLTPKEIALEWGTSAKTLRKFLRTIDSVESPGKGGRYAIAASKAKSLRKGFDAWKVAEDAKRQAAREAAKALEAPEAPEVPEGDEGDEGTETA